SRILSSLDYEKQTTTDTTVSSECSKPILDVNEMRESPSVHECSSENMPDTTVSSECSKPMLDPNEMCESPSVHECSSENM
ncbi:unnamed protein product, partial [Larinioides sclopetarius]